jgi:HTH-type transcriptional regulator, sugar sensing transcriptional regulator
MEAHHYLQALGLTEYEARAYTALLSLGRSQPAKIARHSHIPRPKVYETLERLEARGLATRTQLTPLEYAPLSAREYINRADREFRGRLEGLERSLARLAPEPAPEAVYPLRGEEATVALIEDVVLNATKTLFMAGEPDLVKRLEAKIPRGVRVTTADIRGLPPIAAEGQRPFLVARDGEASVVAHMTEHAENAHGIHSHNPVIVRLVEGYVALAQQHPAEVSISKPTKKKA